MASNVLSKASAWRSKYLPLARSATPNSKPKTAVVVGSTSGIGQAIAHRLAEQGWNVVAVGRHREGRAEKMIEALDAFSQKTIAATASSDDNKGQGEMPKPKHSFVPCDCFSLKSVQKATKSIMEQHDTIDALVVSQGMATTQGFTPTVDGNDEKMTLHYFSRMAFACLLLPAMAKSDMPKGPVALSILSAGVHGPYAGYEKEFSLKDTYSISNAANAAGYYNDLGLDALGRKNPKMNFIHAAPGFVNTNWGTEFNPFLRVMVRCMQPLGRSPADCAEFMVSPTIFSSAYDDDLAPKLDGVGVICIGGKGQPEGVTKEHTAEARESIWKQTVETLQKVGLNISID